MLCTLTFICVCVQAQRDIIFELRRIAFDAECEPNNSGSIEKRKSMYTRDYKKLGFIVRCTNVFVTRLNEIVWSVLNNQEADDNGTRLSCRSALGQTCHDSPSHSTAPPLPAYSFWTPRVPFTLVL